MKRGSTPSAPATSGARISMPARRAREAVRRAAAQRYERDGHARQRPVQFGSRFSKKAFTPSWMSSVVNAIESCERR